ncbi:hypothetical protein [Pseudonocardia sp. MH-G8]|uniref:hypothetical protein n=1 Tax=Pseudonocardia sp. MH-G8 TaxID=1854588 RepID=UPI000BA140A4|nr:hypothetical protein [Pseudonocardia sp. MH-G8]OZM79651.1 hypothetical protein CFP66_24065 [Pseudonocardia sp. MH-G8]
MGEQVEVGVLVKWTPDSEIVRKAVPLRPDHPGIVVDVGPRHVLVDWVRRQHTPAEQGVFESEWLTLIDLAEFERLARRVHELDVAEGGDLAVDERFRDAL